MSASLPCPYISGRQHIQRDGRLVCVDSDGYERWTANPKNHAARAEFRRHPDETPQRKEPPRKKGPRS